MYYHQSFMVLLEAGIHAQMHTTMVTYNIALHPVASALAAVNTVSPLERMLWIVGMGWPSCTT